MHWDLTPHRRQLLGLLLLGAGVVVLAVQFFDRAAAVLWPFFIIVPGLALVAVAMAAGDKVTRLAIPGTTIAGVGMILFFQNLFDHYESWAYVWALIPFIVGLGMRLSSEATSDEDNEAAQQLMTTSLTLVLVLGAIFELFIFGGGGFVAKIVVPLVLILGGAAFLMGWIGPSKDSEPTSEDAATPPKSET